MGSHEHQVNKGSHDSHEKTEKQNPSEQQQKSEGGIADHVAKFHSSKEPTADELYKEFQDMTKKPVVEDNHMIIDPPRYPGDAGTQAHGFVTEDEMNRIREDNRRGNQDVQLSPTGESGGVAGLFSQALEEAVRSTMTPSEQLEMLSATEQMKWGKGTPEINPAIYKGDSAQLMNKVNDYESGYRDPYSNNLMKAMMTEAVLGTGEGLKKIEDLAKKLGLTPENIRELAENARSALDEMGVESHLTPLNNFIGDHGGKQSK